jgi:hypothetical protein
MGKKISYLFILCLGVVSCRKDDEIIIFKEIRHTVIVYMLANNDLYSNAVKNINEMEEVWNDNFKGNLIVFIEPQSSKGVPYILEIHHDTDSETISSPVIIRYPDLDSLNPADMNLILMEIVQQYPAEHYSLVLWSHGTGWLPPNTTFQYTKQYSSSAAVKSFGRRQKTEMSIRDLTLGIPENTFDILIFDACFMGSIEVAFELKDKAEYFIASPTEILAQGFPYKSVIPLFYTDRVNPVLIGNSFFDYYNRQEGEYRSASVGVINLSEIKKLAQITCKILTNTNIPIMDRSEIQNFDRYSTNVFYDFKQTMMYICKEQNDIRNFINQLEKTVIYSAYTDYFLNTLEINSFCGTSCYIPYNNDNLNKYYKTLSWCRESGFNIFF